MEYQSFGRPQRPKGANIKHALKVMLVLAVCAWLVYQIKHSGNKTEKYGGQTKLVAGYEAISLGRKGTPSRLDERALPDSRNVASVGQVKGSSSGRDDVSDGPKEDKVEEEFGHINEQFRTNEGKEMELKPESQPTVSSKNRNKDSFKEKSGEIYVESRSESGHKEHGNEKYQKRAVINEFKSNDKEKDVQLRELPNDVHVRKNAKSDFSVKKNDEHEDPKVKEKETKMQKNVAESAKNAGVIEELDEVQSFHDENGVPPDCDETEIVVGQAHIQKGRACSVCNMEEAGAVESSTATDLDEGDPSSTVLDLTSYQLHDLDSVEFPPDLTELDLTANRLSTVDPRIGHLSHLKKLSLRQNLLADAAVQPLCSWEALSSLEELVLRDNQLKNIPDVSIFKRVLVFDVSFNEITSLHGLSRVSNTLTELYVSKNEVTTIEEIDHFHQLQILELGSNKLRVMENLQNLTNLQELWLGRNRIKVVNLCGLKCIKKISLQSNRLTSMTGFEGCVALEELYLSHNGITKMEGLSSLVNLRVLDVSSNKLTSVDDIQNLTQLEDLWLNDNQIESIEGIAEAVTGSREKLTTVYLENNPCAKSPNYTAILREILPNVQQIDSCVFS